MLVVALEGMPGVGKSTLAKEIVRTLGEKGVDATLVRPFTPESVENALRGVNGPRRRIWTAVIPLAPPSVLVPLLATLLQVEGDGVYIFDRHMASLFALLWAFYTSNGRDYPMGWLFRLVRAWTDVPNMTVFLEGERTVTDPEKRALLRQKEVALQMRLVGEGLRYARARMNHTLTLRRGDPRKMAERIVRALPL